MQAFGILFGLASSILLIGAIVATIVVAVRHNTSEPSEPGIGTVRRIFFYGLGFIALMLAASGATLLLDQAINVLFGDAILQEDSFRIAFGLAASIVGTPIWLLLWQAAERSLAQYPAERGTLGRKSYIYLVLAVSAAVVAVFLVRLIRGVLAPAQFDLGVIAPPIVWGGLWWLHWTWEHAEGQPSPTARSVRRLYAYATATYGLIVLALGTAQLLTVLLNTTYDALFGIRLVAPDGPLLWSAPVHSALSLIVVGGVWWWFHWHRASRGDADSVLRQAVIYLLAIFGGLITVVSASAAILLALLFWLLDPQGSSPALAHFEVVPPALAAIIVGTSVWRYHTEVVLREAAAAGERLVSARRVYRYLAAAVGLGTLAVGLATLFGLFIGLVIPGARGDLTGTRWWADPLSVVLTLIIVGAPLWWRYWSMQQAAALMGAPGERGALPRRIFIFGVFGIAVLATLASLSTFLFLLLEAAFEGRLTVEVLEGGKWALGVVLTAGTISVYYWQVLREDREALAEEETALAPAATAPIEVVALVPSTAAAVVNAIAARLGAPVALWQREDGEAAPELTEAQIHAVAEQIRSASSGRVLVVMDAGGVRVVPFSA